MTLERRRVCILCIVDGSLIYARCLLIIDELGKHFLVTERIVPPLGLLSLFEHAKLANSIDLHHSLLMSLSFLHSF